VKVDNFVFFLHYNVSVGLLLGASLIITVGLYISDPIECTADAAIDEVIDSFCWVHSTFTVPAKWNFTGDHFCINSRYFLKVPYRDSR